jgi:hypothetical protein
VQQGVIGGLRSFLAALVLLLGLGSAWACPICVPTAGPSLTQTLARADTVLLAVPDGAAWRVQALLKGTAPVVLADLRLDPVPAGWAQVVLRDAPDAPPRSIGSVPVEQAEWLQHLLRASAVAPASATQWHSHLAVLQPALEHPSSLMAAIAYDEIARAPYAQMRALKPRLDAQQLIAWLDDPALGARSSLYTLLLGIAGGSEASARIDRQLARAARESDTTDLSARLVADLEMRPPRVRWLEATYLLDPKRALPEVQAALLALSVQGQASGAVPRARVVQAYRRFIRSGHPLAGYVAPDLTEWNDESAVPDYIALLNSTARQQPASIFALLMYLERSSQPAAREAARAYRARMAR